MLLIEATPTLLFCGMVTQCDHVVNSPTFDH